MPFRLVEVNYQGQTNVISQSVGYSDTHDDYEIFLLSSVSNDESKVMDVIKREMLGTSEDVVLVGHSLGAVRQHKLARAMDKANHSCPKYVWRVLFPWVI